MAVCAPWIRSNCHAPTEVETQAELAFEPDHSRGPIRSATPSICRLRWRASSTRSQGNARSPSRHSLIGRRDADLYDRLEKAGFMYNFGEDGSGIHSKYDDRGCATESGRLCRWRERSARALEARCLRRWRSAIGRQSDLRRERSLTSCVRRQAGIGSMPCGRCLGGARARRSKGWGHAEGTNTMQSGMR